MPVNTVLVADAYLVYASINQILINCRLWMQSKRSECLQGNSAYFKGLLEKVIQKFNKNTFPIILWCKLLFPERFVKIAPLVAISPSHQASVKQAGICVCPPLHQIPWMCPLGLCWLGLSPLPSLRLCWCVQWTAASCQMNGVATHCWVRREILQRKHCNCLVKSL